MRTVVYKYKLGFGEHSIDTPKKSKFLSVKKQGTDLVAYFSVPEIFKQSPEREHTRFVIITTGQGFQMERGTEFVDSFLFDNDSFVVHVFKRGVTE